MNNNSYNVNSSTSFSDLPMTGIKDKVENGFTESGDGWIALFDGWVDAEASLYLEGTVARQNVELCFAIDSSSRPVIGASGYLRLADEQDHSSVTVLDGFSILRGEKITLQSRREAQSGTVTVPNGSGIMKLQSKPIVNYGTGPSGTYLESFEFGFGNWINSIDDHTHDGQGDENPYNDEGTSPWDRITDNSGTPSANTGAANAFEGSSYLYAEASNKGHEREFILSTAYFKDLTTVKFAYHLYGASIGILELQYKNGTTDWSPVWTNNTSENAWKEVTIDMYALVVTEIRFIYHGATEYLGDCCIDNIEVKSE